MYYSIEIRTDNEVGSVFPQAGCLSQNLTRRIKFDKFVNFDSEILFQLEPKAKLTDVLSQANIPVYGLLVNKKMKDLMERFNLMQHRFYKCLVKDHKDVTHDYYWLHVSDDSVLYKIDYPKSKFYLRESGFREKDTELSSYQDYKNAMETLGIHYTVSADRIILSNEFDNSLDLFVIPIFAKKKIIITEKMKEELLSQKITGIAVKQYEQVSICVV